MASQMGFLEPCQLLGLPPIIELLQSLMFCKRAFNGMDFLADYEAIEEERTYKLLRS